MTTVRRTIEGPPRGGLLLVRGIARGTPPAADHRSAPGAKQGAAVAPSMPGVARTDVAATGSGERPAPPVTRGGRARRLARAFVLAALAQTLPAAAQDLSLRIPLDCRLGEDCFIQQYVDADPGPGAADYTGGPLAYDGHKGTDFRVADLEAMAEGVPVLAPAAGTVRGVRDAMADRIAGDRTAVAGRECGNGVVLAHPGGWETQLCHLARGSVLVAQGDAVEAGQPVGRIGLSGATQFPHVHLSVRRNGAVVDPFEAGLWQDAPAYEAGGLLTVGLSDGVPEYDAVKAGTADRDAMPADAAALVVTAYLFGGRAGDTLALRIDGPEGAVFAHDVVLERDQAELFRSAGRRTPPEGWPPGAYRAQATLIRDGAALDRLEATATLR